MSAALAVRRRQSSAARNLGAKRVARVPLEQVCPCSPMPRPDPRALGWSIGEHHTAGASSNGVLDAQRVLEVQPAINGPAVAGTARRVLEPSQRLVVRITASADAITSYGTITWSEIGKPGN
jgi:hypothetical protein